MAPGKHDGDVDRGTVKLRFVHMGDGGLCVVDGFEQDVGRAAIGHDYEGTHH